MSAEHVLIDSLCCPKLFIRAFLWGRANLNSARAGLLSRRCYLAFLCASRAGR